MDNQNQDILMISEELKEIANNQKIKCKVSYMEGVTKGIQLERNRKFEPIINAIQDALSKVKDD